MRLTDMCTGSARRVVATVMLAIALLAWQGTCGGCTYLKDRGRDAMDVFTLTIGEAVGVTVRAGPVHTGLYLGEDKWGLKGGEFQPRWDRSDVFSDLGGTGDPFIAFPSPCGWIYGNDAFDGSEEIELEDGRSADVADIRGKSYDAYGICPFVYLPDVSDYDRHPYYYYTQLEVAVGVGISLRVGVNPGEFVDFVLGWVGIDIYGDDLSRIKKKLVEEKSEPAASPGT